MKIEYTYLTSDELMHYGVIGMKWGVRKASYDKNVSRSRNRGDAKRALGINEIKRVKRQRKYDVYSNKIAKLKSKAPSSKRKAKIQTLEGKRKLTKQQIDYGNKVSKGIINNFKKNGYTITSKKVQYDVGTGKQWAANIGAYYLAGPVGYLAVGAARYNAERLGLPTNGVAYKVKDNRR